MRRIRRRTTRWCAFVVFALGCASAKPPDPAIPAAWLSAPEPATPSKPMLDGPIRLMNGQLWRGDKPITEKFAAIDSFDYSESRDEVIFSAKKDASFDIGLAAGDGSKTNWLPADAADELAVQWAPRGNKVSYVVRAKTGDVVRTFHVPTSYQYSVDFGTTANVQSLAWDAAAERFTVSYSTLDASERKESIHYNGSDRRIESNPQTTIEADLVPFGADAFALRPRELRYDEKLPAVVWVSDGFAWSEARARLMREARVASIVITRAPDADFWKSLKETKWIDATKLAVVNGSESGILSFVGDASVPAGHYRQTGNVVAAAPAAIQSVAAGFIADQWKRTSPANGSSL